MDLRAQSQDQNQSPSPGAADVLSTAASTVRDVLSTSDSLPTENAVKPVAKRLPRSAHAPLYEAVHAATEAADALEQQAEGMMRSPQRMLKATTDYVDASPLKAVGIAFLAGWIVGRITR